MYFKGENFAIYHGDNRQILPTLAENSIDAIVTDPPYELGFMGKSWDASGVAFDPATWREALRVLKPGGHLIAFSGSRTYHRMAVAIEDAGFEIRDQIMWIYGSGFPKSHNVSKGIDKSDAVEMRLQRQLKFCAWMRSTGLTVSKTTEILRAAKVISENGTMAGHFFATSIDGQPAVATAELFNAIRPYLPEVPEWVEQMVAERTIESENFKKREVVGVQKNAMAGWSMDGTTQFADRDITTPATAAAKQWDGWGTALKPAHEPMVLARKPLVGTVAANVLTYGTGGLNIDGSRVAYQGDYRSPAKANGDVNSGGSFGAGVVPFDDAKAEQAGRWPANVIHDGSDEVVALFPDSKGGVYPAKRGQAVNTSFASGQETEGGFRAMGDSGSAARFFYCAKASKRDRNEGLDGFEIKELRGGGGRVAAGYDESTQDLKEAARKYGAVKTAKANHHPTVKPTDLMRYLCRLITPPNGTVLDPFMGSGSTGKAAMYEGFKFIGVEMTDEYLPIAKARIEFAVSDNEGFLL